MAMTEVQLEGLDSKRYDPALSYEERSRIRKEARERKSQEKEAKNLRTGSSSRHHHGSSSNQQPVTSSSSSHSTSSSARTAHLQNGSHHTVTAEVEADDGGKGRNGKVSSSSPPLSSVSHAAGEMTGKSKLQSLSHTERNGYTNDDNEPSNSFLAPATPDTYDFSKRRNTPVLSRAQIEALCTVSPTLAGKRDMGFLSHRRDTPVVSPGQLRAINDMTNDLETNVFDETSDGFSEERHQVIPGSEVSPSLVAAENRNGNHADFSLSSILSPDLQSILNGLDGELPKESGDGVHRSLSRQSTHSSSSAFTVDGFDQLLSPTRPKSTENPPSQFFSSSLQFVDTEEPQSPIAEEPAVSIRGPVQKTTVVYRDHGDSNSSLVTMIPSSGFFDPSQSQADVLEDNNIAVQDDLVDGDSRVTGGEKKKKKKSKEPKKGLRSDKTLLIPVKGDVSEKIMEEEEEGHTEGMTSRNMERKAEEKTPPSHQKEEREGRTKRLFGSKRNSRSESGLLTPISRLHESTEEQKPRILERSASSSSAKKSFSPFRKAKKTSQSFREDLREKSASPDRSHLRKLSIPSLESSPSPSRSLGSREVTPESSGSDASSGQGQSRKRRTSIAQKIKNLVTGTSKENSVKPPSTDNHVILKTYKKLEVDDLPSPPGEAASDITTSGSNLDIALSFSSSFEESGTSVTSSGSLSTKKERTVPSRPQSAVPLGSQAKKPGTKRGPRKQSNDLEMPEVKSRLNLSPRSGIKFTPRSPILGVQKKSMNLNGGMAVKNTNSPATRRPFSNSSPSSLSPRSFTRETSVPGTVSPSNSPRSSARGNVHSGKGSPITSPRSSMRGTTSSPGKGSPSTSPRSSMRGTTGLVKVVSPLTTKKISSSSPTSRAQTSADSSRKISGSTAPVRKGSSDASSSRLGSSNVYRGLSIGSPLASSSVSSPRASPAVSKPKTAANSQLSIAPPGSPRTARKSGQLNTSPPKASPLMQRKITPSASETSSSSTAGKPRAAAPLSTTSRKPAPPRLTRVSLDSSEVDSPKLKTSPSFSRFSNSRKPVKYNKSPEVSNQPSPVMERSNVDTAKPTSLSENPERVKPRALSESSTASSPSSHGSALSQRRRRIGISCSESPLLSPVVVFKFFGEGDPSTNPNPTASSVSFDVETLLASVEQKLSDIASSDSTPKPDGENNEVSEVFESSSVFERVSATSQKPTDGERVNKDASHSPATVPSPKSSPLLHKKSMSDQNGSKDKVTVKTKDARPSKQLSSPSVSSKSIVNKSKASKSPLSSKKILENESATPKSGVRKTVTSSRPPKGPLLAKTSAPSKASVSSSKPPVSSMGTTRPRMVLVGGTAQKGKTMSKVLSSPLLPTVSKERIEPDPIAEASKQPAESRRNSVLNRSMRTRSSSRIRPGSANVAGRRASVTVTQQQQQQLQQQPQNQHQQKKHDSDIRRPSLGIVPNRKSMRRVSSGDILKRAKPGSSSTVGRDRRGSLAPPLMSSSSTSRLGGQVYATMRRPKNSAGPSGLTRSTATMSMRLPRKMSVASQKGNTLRRGSKAGGVPPATVADPTALSPSRSSTLKRVSSGGTLRRQSSTGEIMAAFDHISSQAKVLVSSDHRRAVRPKARQKASASHLKILSNRADVSSNLDNQDEEGQLDSNSYSTYMGKKNLAPSAVAGLAAKVDFSTVKLRKTSALQQIMTDQAWGFHDSSSASPGVALGVEYNTNHPVMLLQVKGRRNIQTRLVEPLGTSLNSGDVFIVVTKDKLFHWVGKAANVIEKARGSDVVMRIVHKKELGCKATSATVLKEEERAANLNSKRDEMFWELLAGKTGIKSSESAPGDEVYERAVNMATMVYQLEGPDKDSLQFVPIQENSAKMVTVDLLNTKQVYLFDFYSEVYVWIGNQSQSAFRRKAMELGKKLYDAGCKTPAFALRNSPARSSGRYRPRSMLRSPRHSITNSSGRRSSRVSKADMKPRPEWALFARVTEGSESILFREKFGDWPEAGRIIKMKGHVSSGEVQDRPVLQIELQPADVDKMLKDLPPFAGLRLEGDIIYRGQGNFKVSKSTFSRNRVRTVEVKKWVVKEFDNIIIPSQNQGIFYTSEAYVVRWGYQITVVRDLEGLGPGQGIFARDRAYQKSLQEAKEGKPLPTKKAKKEKRAPAPGDLSDSEGSDAEEEEDEEEKKLLESGGRDRCAYFFWQGENCTVNEKGASALMTVELDKEKGPQVRVEQGKEPPAFRNLFSGGMIILKGKSDTDSLQSNSKAMRVFSVHGQMKNETCLMEVTPEDSQQPLSGCLRSRGCYIVYNANARKVFVWYGSKSTKLLRRCATLSARMLRNRFPGVELIRANEGKEPNDLCSLLGNKERYLSLMNETKKYEYTPRLFELSSTIGEFVAEEMPCPCRSGAEDAFPFDQSHLYSVPQPAMFLVDGWTEVYIWLGWWPVEKNKLLKEANSTTGSSHSRWLRDKKLAMETAQHYVKACKRTRTPRMYVVKAGSEHNKFKNLFPSWEESKSVQELNCQGKTYPTRFDLDDELAKYSRTQFKLEELKQKTPPEGVDSARLEIYLSDADFLKLFKVNKEEFAKMAQWKQTDKKKAVGLF